MCNKKECIKSSIKKQIKVISSYGVELRKQNIPISQTLEIYCSAVADSSYIETDDAQGGTNIVLDVADQPVKHQNKMLVIILGIGILAIGVIAILATINEQISNFAQTYPTNLKASSNEALLFMRRYRFANCSCFSCCFKDAYPSSNVQ